MIGLVFVIAVGGLVSYLIYLVVLTSVMVGPVTATDMRVANRRSQLILLVWIVGVIAYGAYSWATYPSLPRQTLTVIQWGKLTEFKGLDGSSRHPKQRFKCELGEVLLPSRIRVKCGDTVEYTLTVEGGEANYQYMVNRRTIYPDCSYSWNMPGWKNVEKHLGTQF